MSLRTSLRRTLWVVIAAAVLFGVVGFFVLPPIVKAQAERRLSAMLGRAVTVGRVRLNPFAFSATVENFNIREADGKGSFLGWDRLYVRANPLSVFSSYWGVSEISLAGPHVHVAIDGQGQLSFADVLARLTAAASPAGGTPAAPARPVHVAHLAVTDARLAFEDHARHAAFATTLGPLTFVVNNFRTANGPDSPYQFQAVSEVGEKFAYQGWLSTDPLRSGGEFIVENLVLKKYSPYYADRLTADIAAGTLSVRGKYAVNLGTAHPALALSDGHVALRGFQLTDRKSHAPIAELPSVEVEGISADALALSAGISAIRVAGGHVNLRRTATGEIDLLGLIAEPAAGKSAAAGANSAPDLSKLTASIGEISVHDFGLAVQDDALPWPAKLGLGAIEVSLKSLSLAKNARFPLHLAFTSTQGGTVSADGTVGAFPVAADLSLNVNALQILPFSPYVESFVNARITQGAVSTKGRAALALAAGQPISASYRGDVSVENFGTIDVGHLKELAGFASLRLTGVDAEVGPAVSLAVDRVAVKGPYLRVFVNRDGSINLLGLVRSVPAAPTAAAPLPRIAIGGIAIEDGDFSFTDLSMDPRVRLGLNQFGGTIGALSSERMARAAVDLQGRVDGTAPVHISGQLDPLGTPRFVDLSLDFRAIDLLPLSPYSGRFAGYEIARGKVSLAIAAKLNDRAVDLSDRVTLDQFSFGGEVASSVATHLPVRLGVALMKDVNGRIEINVPVKGSLDSPDFRIRDQVLHTLVTLLTKAAVSPFSLLASAFGGGGDELGYDEFAPGEHVLSEADAGKLATVQKALAGRPALNLAIAGSFDRAADTYALKQAKLSDLIRRRIWEAKHAVDPNIPPPEKLAISPEERLALARQLFDAKFPPGTAFGTPVPRRPAVVAAPAPPPPGLWRRLLNFVTFKSVRARRQARQAQARTEAAFAQAKAEALAAGTPLDEMVARLADSMKISDDDLRELATARAGVVRDTLLAGKIAPERIFIVKPASPAAWEKGPRVFLELE